jgi:pyruvate/2-oxoglutarate dehydrogenase complex dihydrolipoamide dehydrogenase (E3) component
VCLDQCFTSSADNEPKTCQQCLESGCVPTAAMVRSRKYTHGEEVKEIERDEKQETRNKRRETRDEKQETRDEA